MRNGSPAPAEPMCWPFASCMRQSLIRTGFCSARGGGDAGTKNSRRTTKPVVTRAHNTSAAEIRASGLIFIVLSTRCCQHAPHMFRVTNATSSIVYSRIPRHFHIKHCSVWALQLTGSRRTEGFEIGST